MARFSLRTAALMLTAGLLVGGTPRAALATDVGDTPSIDVTAVDGSPLTLEQFKGKLVLIDFWATWCGPCMAEAEHMVAIQKKYGDKGLQIVGISLDQDKAALDRIVAEKEFNWPQFFDGRGWDNELAKAWGVTSIPRTFLLDTSGKVVWSGHPAEMDAAIAKAFTATPPGVLDAGTRAKAKSALEFIEKNLAADPIASLQKITEVPDSAKKDAELAAQIAAAQAKLDAAGDKLLADVEMQVTAKQFGAAIKQLRNLATTLEKHVVGTRAKKRLDEILAQPEVKAAMQSIELDSRADAMLGVAEKFKTDSKPEYAYLAYRQVVKQFPKTVAAKTAAAAIADYERDPKFVRGALDIEAGDQAKSLMSLAANYKSLKKYEQARLKYQQVIDQFPGTNFAIKAKQELDRL